MAKILSKFGEQQLVVVNYACGFKKSETGKYFELIIIALIARTLSGIHLNYLQAEGVQGQKCLV